MRAAPDFILNVSDDPDTRRLVTQSLETAGFTVREAPGGAAGLALARERPRLILLDARLSDPDAVEVSRQLKQNPVTSSIPVLQTTPRIGHLERTDEFLAMLAHELRNPLSAIATANELGGRVGLTDDPTVALRATIARHTEHLARLVDDLLEVSRVTRGHISLRRSRVDVREVLGQALEDHRSLAASRRQRIRLEMDPHPLVIDGDPLRLEQIFNTVVNNALKYSAPDTEISIGATTDGADVVIRIRDHGIGIPKAELSRVFDLFAQVDDSLARSVGGIGVGLTLARTLVRLHGGTIQALSEGIGHGTELVIGFPVASECLDPIDRPAVVTRANRPLTIVVMEDHEDCAGLLAMLLKTMGHHVHVTHDGVTGVATAISVRPDATLVDIGLPGIDGFQVAESLRSAEATRDTYLIAITGYGRPEDRARALDAGFDRYIVKPITMAGLEEGLAAAAAATSS